jgi:hypothetical protein
VGMLHQAIPELGLAQLLAPGPGGELQSKSPQPLQEQGAGCGVIVGDEGVLNRPQGGRAQDQAGGPKRSVSEGSATFSQV